jgi:hypothetical protein
VRVYSTKIEMEMEMEIENRNGKELRNKNR